MTVKIKVITEYKRHKMKGRVKNGFFFKLTDKLLKKSTLNNSLDVSVST